MKKTVQHGETMNIGHAHAEDAATCGQYGDCEHGPAHRQIPLAA